jgi:3',5'-cyclic AMP phosphodiesterase CpdA
MVARFVLAQISDLHVTNGPSGDVAAANLTRALQKIAPYRPDLIIATGDLVNDAKRDEYAALAPLLIDPPAPLCLLPGNHDDRDALRAAFPDHAYLPKTGKLSYALENYPIRVVAIDQIVPGRTGGEFGDADALWLDKMLSAAPEKPTVVALHHHPFPSYDLLFDTIGLDGRELLAEIVGRHRQVELVIAGHHHRILEGHVAHAPALVAPSTAYTYSFALQPDQPIARKSEEAGFALHVWPQAGQRTSHFFSI